MPRATRTRLTVDARRAQLLELGVTAFARAPFDQVSVDLIAERAGVSKGLLYHYFETKEDFYAAALRTVVKELHAELERADKGTPIEQLRSGLETYFTFARRYGNEYVALLRGGHAAGERAQEIVEWSRGRILERLVRGLELDASQPLLRVVLRGWIGLVEAACLEWVRVAPRAELERIVDALVSALLAVLATAPAQNADTTRRASRRRKPGDRR